MTTTYERANMRKFKAMARRARGRGVRTVDVDAFRSQLLSVVAEIVLTDKRFRKYRTVDNPVATALFANMKDIRRVGEGCRCCSEIKHVPFGILDAERLCKFPEGKHIAHMRRVFPRDEFIIIWVAFPCEQGRIRTGQSVLPIPEKRLGLDCFSMGCERNAEDERQCAVCQRTSYCSLQCQVNHWTLHQEECRPPE